MKSLLGKLLSTFLLGALFFAAPIYAQQPDYQIGRGFQLGESVTVGGYFSTEYEKSDSDEKFVVDDLAILVYGNLKNSFSYLLEIESINVVEIDFENDETDTNFPPTLERLYGDYKFSDAISVRFGKQITPIGYWNLQPINVLRETTSNPIYSRELFPKFLTGVDFYGLAPFDQDLSYHLYIQNSEDLDDNNINIKTDQHYGFSFEKRLRNDWRYGGSFGKFRNIDKTRTRYYQASTKYESGPYTFTAEGISNSHDLVNRRSVNSKSAYAQGEYRFTSQHALISRVEYFKDERINVRERIGVLGYSYRPLYPVSFKIEYQWHADTNENALAGSFSVLF